MATKNFIVRDKRMMYEVFEKLQKEAGLINNKDFGAVKIAAYLPGASVANFWIASEKLELPLVKKALLPFGLAKL